MRLRPLYTAEHNLSTYNYGELAPVYNGLVPQAILR